MLKTCVGDDPQTIVHFNTTFEVILKRMYFSTCILGVIVKIMYFATSILRAILKILHL